MGNVPSNSVRHGRNAEHVALRDDKYVRCKRCHFMCHLDRDMHASRGSKVGNGVIPSTTNVEWGDPGVWGGTYDITVTSGCPMCGTYLYNE